MNFGFRLAGGRYFGVEPSEIASKIDGQIEQEESARRLLFEPITLEGLIALDPRILTYPENFYSNSILHLAILHTLRGETERARVMLTGLLERDNQYPLRGRSIEVTHAVIDCIDTGRSVRKLLDPIAAENRERYRIVPIKRPAGKKAAR